MWSNDWTRGRGEEILFKILWDLVGIQNVCVSLCLHLYLCKYPLFCRRMPINCYCLWQAVLVLGGKCSFVSLLIFPCYSLMNVIHVCNYVFIIIKFTRLVFSLSTAVSGRGWGWVFTKSNTTQYQRPSPASSRLWEPIQKTRKSYLKNRCSLQVYTGFMICRTVIDA